MNGWIHTPAQVFWWLVEGKFGAREESLAPRLFQLTQEAADTCNSGPEDKCREAEWEMDAPGWALSLGVTAVSSIDYESTHVCMHMHSHLLPVHIYIRYTPYIHTSTTEVEMVM